MSYNIFIVNKCLRITSRGLYECMSDNKTICLFIGGGNSLEINSLFFLKKQLGDINVPLYWLKKLPKSIKKIYTYSDMFDMDGELDIIKYINYIPLEVYDTRPSFNSYVNYAKSVLLKHEKINPIIQDKIIFDLSQKFNTNNIKKIDDNPYEDLVSKLVEIFDKIKHSKMEIKDNMLSKYINNGMFDIKLLQKELMINKRERTLSRFLKRDYYYCLYNPNIHNIRIYKDYLFEGEDTYFSEWSNGKTGFKLIDSAMICSIKTGYLDDDRKSILANFWVKICGGKWKTGEEYFKKIYLDYDKILSQMGWLWCAGILDSRSNRIFNPNKIFPEDVDFIKKWLPKNYNLKPMFDFNERRRIYIKGHAY